MKRPFSEIAKIFNTTPLALVFVATLAAACYGTLKLLFVIFPVRGLKPENTWTKTVGTMTKYALGRNGKGYMHYEINGEQHVEMNNISNYGMVVGEKYNILVNPKNHSEYLMKTWEPVFIHGETTGYVSGRITRVYAFKWEKTDSFTTNHGVEFTYNVMSTDYERSQDLPPEYTGIFKHLKKGDSVSVKYLLKKPQRAILLFRRPGTQQPK